MCEYKAAEGVLRYSQFDKLMSGSSLEGKAFFTKPQNSKLYVSLPTSAKFAAQNPVFVAK